MADTKDPKDTPDTQGADGRDRPGEESDGAAAARRRRGARVSAARVRTIIGQVIWTIAVIAALVLALGALLVAVKANEDNALVKFVLHVADGVDLGLFDRENGIKQFHGSNAATKDALFNWGIGALVYLVVGRILDRILRPRS